jgi:TolB protein
MDADGENHQNLTGSHRNNWAPSWSPDGKRIAFTAAVQGEETDIYVMDADGRNLQQLTNDPALDSYPSWSADGKRIAFMSGRNGNWDIYMMDADGGNPQNLTNTLLAHESHPAWFGPAFAVAPTFSVAPSGKQYAIWGRLKQVAR